MTKVTTLICLGILLFGMHAAGNGNERERIETRGVWVDKSDVYKGKEYLTQMFDNESAQIRRSTLLGG